MQPSPAPVIRIHDAEPTDLPAVVAVLQAANADFAAQVPPSFYRAYLRNLLYVSSRLDESQLLVAERKGHIVGAITFYPDASREGWDWPTAWTGIRATAVVPAARGQGIGRRLTQACIDRSRTLGAPTICLHTGAFMRAAIALYERLGFQRCPAFDREAAAMFGSDPTEPPIPVLAYQLDV
jgi:GNAT superfamily N-acetyltransferase